MHNFLEKQFIKINSFSDKTLRSISTEEIKDKIHLIQIIFIRKWPSKTDSLSLMLHILFQRMKT